jgi:hypothetical protein
MAYEDWLPFDEARGIEFRLLDALDSSTLLSRIEHGRADQRGLSIATVNEAQRARMISLVLACGICVSPTAGVLMDGSLATFLPDSYTEDAIRLCESGWLSRFSSTMGASGDFTMPSMPILCSGCGAAIAIEGSRLYAIWMSGRSGETVCIALKRG